MSEQLGKQEANKYASFLKEVGVHELSLEQAQTVHDNLCEAIQIGLNRSGQPTFEDGGVLAIDTGIQPLSLAEWQQVPVGTEVLAAAFGGTNWITSKATLDSPGFVTVQDLRATPIPLPERKQSFAGFVNLMASEIEAAVKQYKASNLRALAISLGFGQRNSEAPHGIEAQFLGKRSGRGWERLDYDESLPVADQPFLGVALLEELQRRGITHFDRIFFQNDTNSVVHDIPSQAQQQDERLPCGFVFGTGSNAALGQRNLEISVSRPLPMDAAMQRMIDLNIVTMANNFLAYRIGGDYIRYRAASALQLATEAGIIPTEGNLIADMLLDPKVDSRAMSMLAENGQIALEQLLQRDIKDIAPQLVDFSVLTANNALKQAGQLMGAILSSTVVSGGYAVGKAYAPIEGSVFWKAYGVKQAALATLDTLIPSHNIDVVPSSGLRGIAKLAMVRNTM